MRALSYLAWLPVALANPLNLRSTACNNSPDLCDRSYGEITHLGAHDSPFVRDASTSDSLAANQYVLSCRSYCHPLVVTLQTNSFSLFCRYYDTPTQLSAGVRLVTAQVHNSNSQWRLCHTSCNLLDAGLLSDWLQDIKSWLDDNPNEGVSTVSTR